MTFDTTFFMRHYFTNEVEVLKSTREILRRARLQGNCGIVPTIVLAEFYAQAAKRIGASEAERRFNEIADSGLEIEDLNTTISKKAAVIRHKYQEKIPWGDCLIAATALDSRSDYVITDDPEFKSIKEIKYKSIKDINA